MLIFFEFKNSIETLDLFIVQLPRIITIFLHSYPHNICLSKIFVTNSIKSPLFHVPFFIALNEPPLFEIADIIYIYIYIWIFQNLYS